MNAIVSAPRPQRGLRLPLTAGLLLLVSQAPLVADPSPSKIRLRPSHEQLMKQRATGPSVRGLNVAPLEIKEGTPSQAPADLLTRSTIISYRGNWTIVPKNAVMFIPPAYEKRIVAEPEGTLLPWSEFYLMNRGWIHCQTVRMSDARGETNLNEGALAAHQSLGRVVVAVLKGGPISMPPVPPQSPKTL